MCCTNLIEKHCAEWMLEKRDDSFKQLQGEPYGSRGIYTRKNKGSLMLHLVKQKANGRVRLKKHLLSHKHALCSYRLNNIMLFVCVLGIRVTYRGVISRVIPFIPELLPPPTKSKSSLLLCLPRALNKRLRNGAVNNSSPIFIMSTQTLKGCVLLSAQFSFGVFYVMSDIYHFV